MSARRVLIDTVAIYRDEDGYAAGWSAGGTWNHPSIESALDEVAYSLTEQLASGALVPSEEPSQHHPDDLHPRAFWADFKRGVWRVWAGLRRLRRGTDKRSA